MKSILFFLVMLFFGFFDLFYFFVFLICFLFCFLFDFGYFFFGGLFFCDGVSFFLVYLSVFVFIFCVFSSLLEIWNFNFNLGFLFLLFFIFFLLLVCFFTLSGFLFYICFESIFVLMFFFVLGWGYSPERVQASFYMVFYTIVVSFPFLVYMVVFEGSFFSIKFLFLYNFYDYWWVFLFLVFLVKLPVYGVHLWLPKAHVEAPISGSMVLAGVLLKLGGYGMLRFSFFVPFSLLNYSGYLVSLGLLGGMYSCFICLRQVDMKSFVAYSSVCHMGIFLSGVYCYSSFGYVGGVFMLIAHGFCSSCLFYLLYIFYERFHSRSFFIMKGLGVLIPILVFFWFLFSVLNMGVPPSFSFFSEIFVISGLSGMNFFTVFFTGLLLFFSGIYGIFFYTSVCHGFPLLEGKSSSFSVRECLNCYGHFFPLIFVSIFANFFF